MSRTLRHFARPCDTGQHSASRKPLSAASLIVLASLGAVGGLAALNLVIRLYTPG